MPYKWFHEGGMETSGDYEVANRRLVVPNLKVRALGGTVDGRLEMDFKGLAFRTETRTRGISLAQVFAALENEDFPVRSLHWDGAIDVDSVNTWNANFKHFRTVGEMRWSPPATLAAGMIPASARVEFDYGTDNEIVSLAQSQITTPKMQIDFDGPLGAADSGLEVNFRADDLLEWDDFIGAIRGPDAETHRIAGKIAWRGRILGPLVGPSFVGHLHATDPSYDRLAWDALDGDIDYSPDGFHLTKTTITRGKTSANLDLAAQIRWRLEFSGRKPVDAGCADRERLRRRRASHIPRRTIRSRAASAGRFTAAARAPFRCWTRISTLMTSKPRAGISTG